MPPMARSEPHNARVIAHVDMDCFYVQVEQHKNPELRGLPTAVVQYNAWKGGGLIAVGYEARKFGVKRSMRGDDAKEVCPDIRLVQVPVARGKADLNLYRSAGSEVVSILATMGRCERASIDEVYLDLTDSAESMLLETPPKILETIDEEALKSHILGFNCDDNEREKSVREWFSRSDAGHQDKLLACGAIIVAQLRIKVLKETEFTCSAGIAHNKMLAKLASAMHKPAQQTVVPSSAVNNLLASFPIKKMKQLGGKLGSSLQTDLGVNTVGDLLHFSKDKLQEHYGVNTGTWLWNTSRGINGDEVEDRLLPKSHGCGKTYPGPQALKTLSSVENWLNQLCEELSERIQSDLNENKRIAHSLTLHARAFKGNDIDSHKKFPSKSCPLRYGVKRIQEDAIKLFDSALREFLGCQSVGWGVTALSVSASKIIDIPHVENWLNQLCEELSERIQSDLNENKRIAHSLTLHARAFKGNDIDSHKKFPSKSCPLRYGVKRIQEDAIKLFDSALREFLGCQSVGWGVTALSVSASKIIDIPHGTCSIMKFLEGRNLSSTSSHSYNRQLQESTSLSILDVTEESSPSSAGRKGLMIADQETKLVIDASEVANINSEKRCQDKSLHTATRDAKRKDVGASSILRFLQSSKSVPATRSDRLTLDQSPQRLSSETKLQACDDNINHHSQSRNGNDAWAFDVKDIDLSIVDELPEEIQREVRGWLHPPKRASVSSKGFSITNYFLPVKKS